MKAQRTSHLLVAFLVSHAWAIAGSAQDLRTGKPFPEFKAHDAAFGKDFALSDFHGKLVLIDFWATWCGPCRAELPTLKEAHKRFGDKGLEIISISLDTRVSTCQNFIKREGLRWHHVIEGGGWKTRLAQQYKIRSIPHLYLLDTAGKIAAVNPRGSRLIPAIEAALEKTPPELDEPGETPEEAPAPEQRKFDRKAAREWLERGRELLAAKDYVAAAEMFQRIVDRAPRSRPGKAAKEELERMRSDPQIAEVLEQAARQAEREELEQQARSLLEMARSFVKTHRYDTARKYYRRLLEKYPQSQAAEVAKKELKHLP